MDRLRILLAEDHEGLRRMLVALLDTEFDVVNQVGDGDQLVRAAFLLQPDVIISDIEMPLTDGFSARKELQTVGIDRPFVFITMIDIARLPPHLRDGVVGYVHKADLATELSLAIHAVAQGTSYVSRSFAK
jgi:DNA-binding NarL/FixJ family response regulator